MKHSFFALISRMRYIGRWGLMRNSLHENVQEHSHMVAVIAHSLAVIGRDIYGKDLSPEKCAAAALYHDASEILTGDLPTPIKYHDEAIRTSYKEIEKNACIRLLSFLPDELRPSFEPLLIVEDPEILDVVKAADKLSAYIKCIEERKAGNNEFISAEAQLLDILKSSPLPEVAYFMQSFIPPFELTLDELGAMC
ncbi:MAG: 5'-deoxynucleotidase [Oscillospiraceae bacterium]|nr:5'-deoxynucleotidase [Oscillospiraceae bacterium]